MTNLDKTQDFEHSQCKITQFLEILETEERSLRNPILGRFKIDANQMIETYKHNKITLNHVLPITDDTQIIDLIQSCNCLSTMRFLIHVVRFIRRYCFGYTKLANFKHAELYLIEILKRLMIIIKPATIMILYAVFSTNIKYCSLISDISLKATLPIFNISINMFMLAKLTH